MTLRLLRLKPQPKLPPFTFLAHLVQKPRNGILLHQARRIKMLPHRERKLLLCDAVLTMYLVYPVCLRR